VFYGVISVFAILAISYFMGVWKPIELLEIIAHFF